MTWSSKACVKGGLITVPAPESLPEGTEVSVQVEPLPEREARAQKIREFLLNGPTFTEEELRPMLEGIEEFRKWKV